MRYYISHIVFILVFCTFSSYAQTLNEVEREVTRIMEAARKDNSVQLNTKLVTETSASLFLEAVKPYYTDTIRMVRSKAYYITKKAGLKAIDPGVRIQAVASLVAACKDKDTGLSGMASRYLTEFKKNDFDDEAKQILSELLQGHPAHFDRIIKLVGFVELTDQEDRLFEILYTDSLMTNKIRWSIHLALARMGNEEQIQYCVNKVMRYPVNDDVVYELLPDLIYVRQKEAIDYLVEVLNSDSKDCSSPNPSIDENMLCGYRVMEYLAPIIVDFPLKVGPSGDIQDYEYTEALQIARTWFNENSEYQIVKDTY